MIDFYTDNHYGILVDGKNDITVVLTWCNFYAYEKHKVTYLANDIIYVILNNKEDFELLKYYVEMKEQTYGNSLR